MSRAQFHPTTAGDSGTGARGVVTVVRGLPTSDGAGVRLTRVIGTPTLPDLDPFLLLDEFGSDEAADYIAGFPDHPHRGFETVTYMLAGRMRHGDNQGNVGLLRAGSVQWMTAGRGIVHSEMPEQEEGLLRGFQLWVNLPAKDKMTAPRYQDIAPEAIPMVDIGAGPGCAEGGFAEASARVRVIAGRLGAAEGPVRAVATQPLYLDIALGTGATSAPKLPVNHTAFVYVYEGAARIGSGDGAAAVQRGELAVLGPGGRVEIAAAGGPARLLLVAARPLGEPIARYGPFVMNTDAEIRRAIEDYRAGRL
ncbi:MAG: pirin family protein [Dongiaceae bacterium]